MKYHHRFQTIGVVIGVMNILVSSMALCQVRDCILPVKPADIWFGQYYYFENGFDSAYVSCMIGEFTVRNSLKNVRAYFPELPARYIGNNTITYSPLAVHGMNGQGRDTIIEKSSVTDTVTIPTTGSSTVTFYRELSGGGLPCGKWRDRTVDSGRNNSAQMFIPNYKYNVGVNNIPDRTEFRIEIVRYADNTVLHVVDSVGVNPNPTYKIAYWYGTTPEKLYHERALPASLAGEKVYFRIVPYRWGPTPEGMNMNRNRCYLLPYSMTSENFENGPTLLLTRAQVDSLYELHWVLLQQYYDSVIIATGRLPNGGERSKLPELHVAEYYAKYFDQHTDSATGRTSYRPKDFRSYRQVNKDVVYIPKHLSSDESTKITAIYPTMFSPNTDCTIALTSTNQFNGSIVLISSTGTESATLFTGNISQGHQKIPFNIGNYISKGIYFIVVKNSTQDVVAFSKVLLTP